MVPAPPVAPLTNTIWPGSTFRASTAVAAAAPASGNAAAVVKSTPAGLQATASPGNNAYSARVPAWMGGASRT